MSLSMCSTNNASYSIESQKNAIFLYSSLLVLETTVRDVIQYHQSK